MNYGYKTQLPFNEPIKRHIDGVLKRIEQNKATLIIVDGQVGEGKTTLAVEIGDYIEGKDIIFNNQLGMGAEEFKKKLHKCIEENHKVCIYDEAGDYDKVSFMSNLNKEMNRIFDIFRTFKIVIIIVLPAFYVLSTRLFEKGTPRLLLHTYGRDNKRGVVSIYGSWRMQYLKFNMTKKNIAVPQQQYTFTKPNDKGFFHNLSKERSKELDEYSTKGKQSILKGQIVHQEGLITAQEIGNKLGGYSLQWTSIKLKENNIKPVSNIGRKNYYDKNVYEQLKHLKRNFARVKK